MADSNGGIGGFRTQFSGFNKDDVIAYINKLQEEQAGELEELKAESQRRYAAYEKALEDANSALREQYGKLQEGEAEQDNLQTLINEQYAVNRQLREQVEALTVDGAEREELERLRRENADMQIELEQDAAAAARLRQQLEAADREREVRLQQYRQGEEEFRLAQQQMEEKARRQQEAFDTLRAENDRYHQLVNDVGGFVVDVRAMGKRYLDDASSRCDSRLAALADVVTALQDQLTAASADLAEARDALREQSSRDTEQMDAMGDEMMRTAAGLEKTEPVLVEEDGVKEAPLPEEPAPADAPADPDFF